jgi:hypothetical protein
MHVVVVRGTSIQCLGSAILTQYFFDTAEELLDTEELLDSPALELLEDGIS